jgi:TetR/AcrR family transcriptional regulator, transcriptional repressor of aconitase
LPKVSKEYLASRREEILDAALRCFSRDGFHRTTMQDIVRESGLSPGAIYNYFKSKEEIVEAIANQRQAKEKQLLRDAVETGPADGALERIRDAFLDELNNPKERLRRRVSVQLWAEAQRNHNIRRLVRRSFEEPRKLISEILSTAQTEGTIATSIDPDALASFLIAAFHGLVLQREWDDKFSSESHKAIFNLLLEAATAHSNAAELELVER